MRQHRLGLRPHPTSALRSLPGLMVGLLLLSSPLAPAGAQGLTPTTGQTATTRQPFTSTSTSSAPTQAQASAATAQAGAIADIVSLPVWPKAAVVLPETPVATQFSLGQVEGVSPKLLSGVIAKGFARKVDVENQSIGQVLVTTVAKDDKEEAIGAQGLTAQFDAQETSQLFPEKTVTVEGSRAALIAALEKLNEKDDKDKDEKKGTDPTKENAVAGNAAKNDQASSYRSPTLANTPAKEDDPVTEIRTSTQGCSIRIDLEGGKAIVQNKQETYTDGAKASETACSDSDVSYTLKRSYLACPDKVDLQAMKAWPQFSVYYVDGNGSNQQVADCAPDSESPLTITEDESLCTVALDFKVGTATPRAALVYLDKSNKQVSVRGCEPSTKSQAITMTQSTSGCSMRHDFQAGKSYENAMWTYQRAGVTYQAQPCTETGRTFDHETVIANAANDYVCTPIVSLQDSKVTLQSRVRISVDGAQQFISECAPEATSQAIVATTDGCTDPAKWSHDITAGVSYGQERFFYDKLGSRQYVTDCQTSKVSYRHDQQITGYQYHDDQLFAYPLMTVTIAPPSGKYAIKTSEVLPGATQLIYVADGTKDVPSGLTTYDGCTAYAATKRSEVYTRPDGTSYAKEIGDGTPVKKGNACTAVIKWSLTDKNWDKYYFNNGGTQYFRGTRNCYYSGTKTVTREDGTIVSTLTASKNDNRLGADPGLSDPGSSAHQGEVTNPCNTGSLRTVWQPGWGSRPVCDIPGTRNGLTMAFGTDCPVQSDLISTWNAELGW